MNPDVMFYTTKTGERCMVLLDHSRCRPISGPLPTPDFARHFGSPSVPKPPPPPPPPPTPEDPSIKEAGIKEKDKLRKRRGRASTLLSGDTLGAGGTLGGGA